MLYSKQSPLLISVAAYFSCHHMSLFSKEFEAVELSLGLYKRAHVDWVPECGKQIECEWSEQPCLTPCFESAHQLWDKEHYMLAPLIMIHGTKSNCPKY